MSEVTLHDCGKPPEGATLFRNVRNALFPMIYFLRTNQADVV